MTGCKSKAFLAPILQADGCSLQSSAESSQDCHNMFFDLTTMEPLVDNPGFKHAVELHSRFMQSSNCHLGLDQGSTVGYCNRKTAFPTGRCAGVISMPGTMSNLLKPGGKYAVDVNQYPIDVASQNTTTTITPAGIYLSKLARRWHCLLPPRQRSLQQHVAHAVTESTAAPWRCPLEVSVASYLCGLYADGRAFHFDDVIAFNRPGSKAGTGADARGSQDRPKCGTEQTTRSQTVPRHSARMQPLCATAGWSTLRRTLLKAARRTRYVHPQKPRPKKCWLSFSHG